MDNRGFIPGVWEEEINVTDFLNLNSKKWSGPIKKQVHELFFDEEYDVLKDENEIFTFLVPLQKEISMVYNKKHVLYLGEKTYSNYTETSDRKKFLEIGLISPEKEEEKWAFVQPELCTVPLYGTKEIVRTLKQYVKDLDKQFQTQEWTHRKISHHRSIKAIQEYEEFALKHGVNVRKPCTSAVEVANSLWMTSLYSLLENPEVSFSFHSIFSFLDIFIEKDIQKKKLKEREAQLLVDELYCKLAALRGIAKCSGIFDFSVTMASSKLNKTSYRLLESALEYKYFKIPFQLIFNTEEFPKEIYEKVEELFNINHPISISQSLRKRDANNLSLTSAHTFFRNFEDITMHFASFDLQKAFVVALNGGKDVGTNSNVQQVTKALDSKQLDFDSALMQFEMFLKYYITLYTEYINTYAYYFDMFHDFPFRQSMISSYPYYLMNVAYHNVSPVVNLLTAIYEEAFELKTNKKGYIEEIVPLTDNREEFIGAKLNEIIHNETKRMLFYKNGHYNILFFAECPFFKKEDRFDTHLLSPMSFSKTSFSGFQLVEENEFEKFFNEFISSNYTHIRIRKK